MGWFFAFFFLSGFCSILYELVWLRLSMAEFGVTTALTSIVLSMFMTGMGAGSWGAGILVRRYGHRLRFPPLRLYALCEFLIGCSSLAVPAELLWGHRLLESMTAENAYSSGSYYLASGILIAAVLLPWCACMGATFPLAMAAIRSKESLASRRSFSFLYVANVIGAVAGAIAPLFLIELYGLRSTMQVGTICNFVIAALALSLTLGRRRNVRAERPSQPVPGTDPETQRSLLVLLFMTGLATMGMEVIWIREFTPYAGPVVYSFAFILVSYLSATFVGSFVYRRFGAGARRNDHLAWVSLAFLGVLSLLTSDPRFHLMTPLRIFLGVAPFAGCIGYLTPMLVDRWSAGDPDRAGRAYAINVVGCILGPLLSGFVLLPLFGERVSILLFAMPWMAMAFLPVRGQRAHPGRRIAAFASVAVALVLFFTTKDFETLFPHREVLRDSTATVIATGSGMHKRLLTNGIGITELTPITKMMAHLTLASLPAPPQNALVICFGMGTTYKSVMSWGIPTTVVELVPSVPRLFTYYHPDGAELLRSPLSHLVIDDGRRFLERTTEKYDAIIIDPPPPVRAAGSSLLYSEEFYAVARDHLRPGGILAQWLPSGDRAVQSSVAKALQNSFKFVRIFRPVEDNGWHFLASMESIAYRSADELVARMPAPAVEDMMAWGPAATPTAQFNRMLQTDVTTQTLISCSPGTPALDDDRPVNEYDMLRNWSHLMKSGTHDWTPGQYGAASESETKSDSAEEKKVKYEAGKQ
jgi:spermidine synthase